MAEPTYRYLDLRPGPAAWPGATAEGVVYADDDCVRLAPLPADPSVLTGEGAGGLAGAASVAVAGDGTIYVADTEGRRILEVLCDGTVVPYACLDASVLSAPRGVLVGPRDRLYVADGGGDPGGGEGDEAGTAGRVLVVDRPSGTVVDVWTDLGEPVDLAADAAGALYVADAAGGRIVRLDADGVVDPSFAPTLAVRPVAICTLDLGAGERLLVVGAGGVLVVLDLAGAEDAAAAAAFGSIAAEGATGVAADGEALYLATPGGVIAFAAASGSFLGVASPGHAVALALDCRGRLVAAGDSGVHRLEGRGRARIGRLLLGPLPLVDGIARWDRVAIELGGPLPPAAHVRLWTRTGAAAAQPPFPPPLPEPGEDRLRTAPGHWRASPLDAPDALVLHEPAAYLWLCLELSGDGTASPAIRSVRADHLGTGLPGRLPAIYAAADADETTFRVVQLLAAPLDAIGAAIADLPRGFDAAAAPADRLDGLGAWVAQSLDDRLPLPERRAGVGEAFVRHGLRGTRAELERTLSEVAGAPVRITEPAQEVDVWSLGESPLGWRTMLVPAEAQGAVVGTTAVVDGSHLIVDEDRGWPLNADVAHRFCVHVDGELERDRERELRAAVEREKPAHTLASVCVRGEPRLSVGSASVGPESRIGGRRAPAREHTAPAVGGRVGGIRIGGRR